MNPALWLQRTALSRPARPALFTGDKPKSDYAGFCRAAAAIGAALRARGLGPGARVAVFMSNRVEYLEALYGIWFSGAAAVPINGKLHPEEAAWIIADAGAALVLTSDDIGQGLATRLADPVPVISVDGAEFAALKAAAPMPGPERMRGDDLLWLFYTSGTTGRPKGVMITCRNIAAMAFAYLADVDAVRDDDAILYAAPMSHGAGLYNFMHVLRGARHVVPENGGFDPREILDLAPRIGDVSMFAAPTMVRRLIDAARADGKTGDGIRTIVYGGGPMYLADITEAVNLMGPKFVQIYGQGECPMAITALSRRDVGDHSHKRWRDRLASVGVAQSVSEVAILDAEGSVAAPGAAGEIAVRGDAVMAGYWRNPDATAQALRDGWLRTGDIGHMDRDGYVTLVDRSKDMIISGGSNIYPREVEEVLLTHAGVRECAVVGRPHPDWGEEVVAVIVADADLDPAELDRLCLDRIARFKRPKDYMKVAQLPRNNYGKVLKTDLRRLVAARLPTP